LAKDGAMILESSLAAPLLLGITYAALPGVVNTEAFRRGVRSGFLPAASIQIGALIGDGLWAVMALTGAALLLQHDLVALTLGLAGAGFLFHLARTAVTGALHGAPVQATSTRQGNGLVTGVVFSLANPAGLAFWTGIGGGMLGASASGHGFDRAAGFLLAFLAGALLWGVAMAALVAWGRRFATPAVFRVIEAVCGLALAYFGLRLLWSTLQRYGRLLSLLPRGLA
jgi:threonine/homoserine/homoserine lactone efflux protein